MAVIEWKQVKPDFSSSNNSMQNAMSGLSNAGTVFDKLRQSILDEEQRALDNAYKQQTFDENVRQFELQQALNREKFDEETRQFNVEQQWKKDNAEAERKFKAEESLKDHQRAMSRIKLEHKLDEEADALETAGYNTLNAYFLKDYETHGDLQKADKNTRAFAATVFPKLRFDEKQIYGNYADPITNSYLPDERMVRIWNTVKQGRVGGSEKVSADQQLRDNHGHMAVINGKVLQEVNGTVYPVPESEAQAYLQLRDDRERFAKLEQEGLDTLVDLGMNPLQANNVLNYIGSQSILDQEKAVLEIASSLGVTDPSKIPLFKAIIEGASNARKVIAAKAEAEEERKKTFTEAAYSRAYNKVFTKALEDGDSIFDAKANPQLAASIEIVANAMRGKEVSSDGYERFLVRLRKAEHTDGLWTNNDITSEKLDNPILKEYREEYLPELIKPKTEEKPKSKTPATATSGSTKSNPDSVKPPLTGKLENIDSKAAGVAKKALEGQRQLLENAQESSVGSGLDADLIEHNMALLNAAIKNLNSNTPIVVSNVKDYEYLRKMINTAVLQEVSADKQGKPVFTQVPDLDARLLRLDEEVAKQVNK